MKVVKSVRDVESLEFGEQFVIDVGIDPQLPGEETEEQFAAIESINRALSEKFASDLVRYECRPVEAE